MTLRSGDANYLGFIRANNTIVENCVINGKTFYWGYETAIFSNTIFNCPALDYAIWTYSSPVMTSITARLIPLAKSSMSTPILVQERMTSQ